MESSIRRVWGRLLIAAAVLAPVACTGNDVGAPPEGTVFVEIGDNFFEPLTVTVPQGRSVRWTNGGAGVHTVVSDAQLWQSDFLQPTWWFEVRFEETGTFDYHCSLHEGMTGTVIVE